MVSLYRRKTAEDEPAEDHRGKDRICRVRETCTDTDDQDAGWTNTDREAVPEIHLEDLEDAGDDENCLENLYLLRRVMIQHRRHDHPVDQGGGHHDDKPLESEDEKCRSRGHFIDLGKKFHCAS